MAYFHCQTLIRIRIRTQIPVYADTMGKGSKSGADRGFPVGGAPTLWGWQHTILSNFPKNCMKSREFGL